MKRRLLAVALLAAAGLTSSGCLPKDIIYYANPWLLLAKLMGYDDTPAKGKTSTNIETTFNLDLEVQVGGVGDPSYTVVVGDGDGGNYGIFEGTGVIKRGRFVTIKDAGTDGLKATVQAMLSDALEGASVTVTEASATVKASQTPGGVDAVFKGKVKFRATVESGPYAGATVKGKLSGEGSNPTNND